MLPVLTAQQMRDTDRHLIQEIGIPSLVLMENAARGVLEAVEQYRAHHPVSIVAIFCGTGNNGGDGLALARLLFERNIPAQVYLVGPTEKLSTDAKEQYDILHHLAPALLQSFEPPIRIERDTLIVDALLGTGSAGELKEPIASAVRLINESARIAGVKIFSIDIPTGLDADHGTFESDALIVRAYRTITIGAAKQGFYQGESKAYTGTIHVAPFGAPVTNEYLPKEERTHLVEAKDIIKAYPKSHDTASKFSQGRVFALCGSRGMTGAAIMAASSALRSGCGLVNVALPASERSLVAQAMPELLTVGCAETDTGMPSIRGWEELQPHIAHADVVLLGSGLRPGPEVSELMLKIISEIEKPMIIDAGALGALVGKLDILKKRTAPTIITPHSGEIARLVERNWQEVEKERFAIARRFARENNVVVVMKGAPTYVFDTTGEAFINSTGNAGLATAGSGDVLAGILAGTFAQMPKQALETAMIGVYLHGLAGDLAKEELTTVAMTATDVTRFLPRAFKRLGIDERELGRTTGDNQEKR